MSKQKIEDLSALIDGEYDNDPDAVIGHICRDEQLRQAWARYHLISDCLKGHLPEHISMSVGEGVHRLLETEPTVLVPKRRLNHYLRPAVGFAIAASVAVVAILAIQHNNSSLTGSDAETLAAKPSVQGNIEQYTFAAAGPMQPVSTGDKSANSRMNSYLVNYNEQRANAGMQGIFPYVRIVAHEKQE